MIKKNTNAGITLIALVITIIVLLILAGVTIAQLTGSDSAPAKANEAKQKNNIGTVKEEISLFVHNDTLQLYDEYYVKTSKTNESQTLGSQIIQDAINTYDGKTKYDVRISITQEGEEDAQIELASTDFVQFGTIDYIKGTIIWGALENGAGSTYTISYELNDGSFENNDNIVYSYRKGTIVKFETPVKENFAFDGWYITSDFSGEKLNETKSNTSGNLILYAKWIQETSTTYFSYNSSNNTITGFSNDGIQAFKNGALKELVLPKQKDGVYLTAIGSSAFDGNNSSIKSNGIIVEKVLLPNTVTSIEPRAFIDCSSLKSINLDNITSIGDYAFCGCTSMTELIIPEGITSMQEGAFAYMGITKLVIPDSVTSLTRKLFLGDSKLTDLTIPITINSIKESGEFSAFYGCANLTKIKFTKGSGSNMGNGFNYTGNGSETYFIYTPWYYSRENQMNVEFEDGITSIGNFMFSNCTGLQNFDIPNTVTSIGTRAFFACSSMVGEFNTIENVTSVGERCFCGCSNITGTLIIPTGLTTIQEGAFEGTKISKLVIHDEVTNLNKWSFADSSSLTDLTIPITLNAVAGNGENSAFLRCNQLTKVRFTKGSGSNMGKGYNYSWGGANNFCIYSPWYYSKDNKPKIIFEKGITWIGNNTIYDIWGLSINYEGTEEEWAEVTYDRDKNNAIGTVNCNYSE